MGTTRTPAFRVEVKVDRGMWTPAGWDSKHLGRPTQKTLAEYVRVTEESTKEGGCNSHLGETKVLSAQVIRQADGVVVARYAPVPTLEQIDG